MKTTLSQKYFLYVNQILLRTYIIINYLESRTLYLDAPEVTRNNRMKVARLYLARI